MNRDIKEIIKLGETEKVEFKLNFNNNVIISSNAFANTKGGKILIGVKDNGDVIGVEINNETIQKWINEIKNKTNPSIISSIEIIEIEKKRIAVFDIDEYPIKPVSLKGRYYKRVKNSNHQMSITEISNDHLKTVNSSWDFYTDTNHTLENISLDKVKEYIKVYEEWNNTSVEYEPLAFLSK